MRRWLAAALLLLGACVNPEDGPFLVEGTTYRIAAPEQVDSPDLTMELFTSREACIADRDVLADEVDDCVPRVDRASGQVRLAFGLRDPGTGSTYELPLTVDDIVVTHDGLTTPGAPELTAHHPVRASQLFIVLIDGSGSMFAGENPVVNKVYRALMNERVIEAFFPDDANVDTGVVLLRFTNGVTGLDGGPPRVISDPRGYRQMVRGHLMQSPRGYTHLYSAVEYGIGPLMEEQAVKEWLALRRAEPTIIALTDGFNNEEARDRCGDNAQRLSGLLESIQASQLQELHKRPRIYTVGLGRALRPNWDFNNFRGQLPGPESLCGRYAGEVINGRLENQGIDNASLEWIASYGKGETYVENNDRGLAQVFLDAAAVRYAWYDVQYTVDPFYHRRSFASGIELRSYARGGASVQLQPSGWIDAPTPRRKAGSVWTEPRPVRAAFGLLVPVLAGLILLHFLGPASFNGRRAITRRARKSGRKKRS